jgi:signal transduction histidine kinase
VKRGVSLRLFLRVVVRPVRVDDVDEVEGRTDHGCELGGAPDRLLSAVRAIGAGEDPAEHGRSIRTHHSAVTLSRMLPSVAAPPPSPGTLRSMDRRDRLIEAGMILASELSLDAVLQRIIELAVEITDARYGALGVIGPDGDLREFITTGITPEEREAIGAPPHGRGILGALIEERKPMRLPDISADPRSVGFPPNHPKMTSFLGAPIVVRGDVFGDIYLTNKRRESEFEERDERDVMVLAAQAGVAIENARLYDEIHRLVVLEDRERIAKELHDGVIQSLFAVGMGLQGTAMVSKDEELATRIERAVADIDGVIRDLRNYIFGLRPGILADRKLDEALRHLGEEFQQRSGVTTVVDVDPAVASELTPAAADILQLTREALSNVGRHAHAATCRISLYRSDDQLILEVDDDGKGFDPNSSRRGDGLTNMEARGRALSATISIESARGEGTTIRVALSP